MSGKGGITIGAWLEFIFLYPVIMSLVWMIGSLYFSFRYERNRQDYPDLEEYPLVSVIVPAHNEQDHICETIQALLESAYPEYEIIVINDGSTDNTETVIRELTQKFLQVRGLTLAQNMGKAAALNYGIMLAKGEIVVSVDADCLLDSKAIHWLVYHFVKYPRVGAVTGNPRVRNRTSLLAKIQTAEYCSVIGLIKRTQRILGKIMTISGVIAAFRKRALVDCGLWSTDMVTEDIDITWKLQKNFWAVHYELNAIGWILVPETLRGLWRQRLRWAQGGIEVLQRHIGVFGDWRKRRLWPVYLDYVISVFWAFSFMGFTVVGGLGKMLGYPLLLGNDSMVIVPQWTGSIIALICLLQFGISFLLDRKYDSTVSRYYFWVIWYPAVYWVFNALTLVWAVPRALLKKTGTIATWKSPDRGLRVMRKPLERAGYYGNY